MASVFYLEDLPPYRTIIYTIGGLAGDGDQTSDPCKADYDARTTTDDICFTVDTAPHEAAPCSNINMFTTGQNQWNKITPGWRILPNPEGAGVGLASKNNPPWIRPSSAPGYQYGVKCFYNLNAAPLFDMSPQEAAIADTSRAAVNRKLIAIIISGGKARTCYSPTGCDALSDHYPTNFWIYYPPSS